MFDMYIGDQLLNGSQIEVRLWQTKHRPYNGLKWFLVVSLSGGVRYAPACNIGVEQNIGAGYHLL